MKTLFKTCVGSHIWNMNTPESDMDIFKCYIAPSEDFLIGKSHRGGHHSQIGDIDTVSVEVGTVVEQLLKNNLNYLINVLSPIPIKSGVEHEELKKLAMMNLSKLCYNSIRGMAVHNYKKYIEIGKNNNYITFKIDFNGKLVSGKYRKYDTQKRRKTIVRTLQFGITLLQEGRIEFKPVNHCVLKNEIVLNIEKLDIALENSILPEKPQHSKEMYDWLLNLRLENLATLK